jgi:hypothetical protein
MQSEAAGMYFIIITNLESSIIVKKYKALETFIFKFFKQPFFIIKTDIFL